MPKNALLEWEGREYDHNPKSADWYWALGIIAIAGIVSAILFENYLIALLVFVAAAAVALHAAKHPPMHQFRLTEQGLVIGEELHPYDRMESFSLLEDIEDELPPLLSIKTHSWLSPHLVIPLRDVDAETVYAHFLANVDENAHEHSVVDLVASWLGF